MTNVLALAMLIAWCGMDHADDGVDIPLHRLAYRQATARRIDPGIALAECHD